MTELPKLNERAWALHVGDPRSAAALASDVVERAERLADRLQLGLALRTLGACQVQQGQHRAAREPLQRAAALFEPYPEHAVALAQTRRLLVRSHFLDQEYEQALEQAHAAVAAAREAGDEAEEASALNAVGIVYADMGATDNGLEYLLASIAAAERQGIAPSASPLNNIGNLHMLQEHPEQALDFFLRARAAFREEGRTGEESVALGNAARAYEALGDHERAREHHERAVALARSSGQDVQLGPALTKLGTFLTHAGDTARARECLHEALEAFRSSPNSFCNETMLALAELELVSERPREALELYREVLDDGSAAGKPSHAAAALHGIARAHEAMGEWRSALERHKAYHELQAELDRRLFSGRSRALLLQHKLDRSRREEDLLRGKNRELEAANAELRRLHAALERQALELERISLEDPLTGLPNRRAVERRLGEEIARCRRYGGTFSVLMCDIDEFKPINDQFSHAIGDEVLKRLSAVLRRRVRQTDVPARIGGEEFLVLLPETVADEAVLVAEQIRQGVESYPWSELRPGVRVTLSIGIAHYSLEYGDAAALLQQADIQLYRAKRSGRNRVCGPGGLTA